MNDYLYMVMLISTFLGFVGGGVGAIFSLVSGFMEDPRWFLASAACTVVAILSLAWGLVYA